jgi:hypothetical protein
MEDAMTSHRLPALLLAGLLAPLLAATSGEAQPLTTKLVFTAVQPCRIVDTRAQVAGPLLPGIPRTFHVVGSTNDFAGQGGQAGGCGIPGYQSGVPQAEAVMVNLVAVGPLGAGNLRAWPSDQAVPNASVINYDAVGLLNIANAIALPLSRDAVEGDDLTIRADVSGTHIVVDVVGFFTAAAPSQVLHLSGLSFVATVSDVGQVRGVTLGMLTADNGKLVANVPIPAGTVTGLTLCAHDNDADFDVAARLIAKPVDSFTEIVQMAEIKSSGGEAPVRCFTTNAITQPQIDPTAFAYYVELEFTTLNNIEVVGVQVRYTP